MGGCAANSKHPGFLALHVAVDDHSRMAFTRMLPDQKADTTIAFLNSAIEFFATPRHRRARPAHRQRLQLPLAASSARPARRWQHQTPPHPALHATNQRQGRAIYPDRSARVGLRKTLDRLRAKRRITCSPGPTTTTTKDLMVASTTSRPSAAPTQEQPLDHLQPPSSTSASDRRGREARSS